MQAGENTFVPDSKSSINKLHEYDECRLVEIVETILSE